MNATRRYVTLILAVLIIMQVAVVAMMSRPSSDSTTKPPRTSPADPDMDAVERRIAEREADGESMTHARDLLERMRRAREIGDKAEVERLRREVTAAVKSQAAGVAAKPPRNTAGKPPLPEGGEPPRSGDDKVAHPKEPLTAPRTGQRLSVGLQSAFDRASSDWPGIRDLYARGKLESVEEYENGQVVLKFRSDPPALSEFTYFAWADTRSPLLGVEGMFWVSRSESKPFSKIMDARTISIGTSGQMLHTAVNRSSKIRSVTLAAPPRVVLGVNGEKSHGDIWVSTWADNGDLYVGWGDGRGFGHPYITDIGYGRLRGELPNVVGEVLSVDENLLQGTVKDTSTNDKPSGLLAVGHRLYAHQHRPLGDPDVGYLAFSDDGGVTWERRLRGSPWTRDAGSMFRCMFFINMGKGYALNEDGYVYALGIGREYFWSDGRIYLARVPSDAILSYDRYEYFSGREQTQPVWSRSTSEAIPLPGIAVRQQVSAMYHAGVDRYLLLTEEHLFDAPKPWGPWTYVDTWIDHAPAGWRGGYMPGIISKDAGDRSFWFAVAGGSMTDEADRADAVNYRLHLGEMILQVNEHP